MEKMMVGLVKKVYLKPVLFVSLFLVLHFVGSTASFAVENQDADSNTQIIYAQSSESNSSSGSVVDYIFSLVTPNDACAEDASPFSTCQKFCETSTGGSKGCCDTWIGGTAPSGCSWFTCP